MSNHTYTHTIEEKPYTFELDHSLLRWRLTLRANGVTLIDGARLGLAVEDYPFTLDGHSGFVRNRRTRFQPCNLALDGVSVIDGEECLPLLPMPGWGRLFLAVARVFLLAGVFFLLALFFLPEPKAIPYLGYLCLQMGVMVLVNAPLVWIAHWLSKKIDFKKRDPSVGGSATALGILIFLFYNMIVTAGLLEFLTAVLLPYSYYFNDLVIGGIILQLVFICFYFGVLLYPSLSFHPRDPKHGVFNRVLTCSVQVALCGVMILAFFNLNRNSIDFLWFM